MKSLAITLFLVISPSVFGGEIMLPQKTYSPVFREVQEKDSIVGPLLIDETPITNQEFLKFLKTHTQFLKSKIPTLFADSSYLSHWPSDLSFVKSEAKFPVTQVSWFVARKYCEAQGKRLPTIEEWETASDAQDPKIEAKILEWYGKPGTKLKNVGEEPANKFGIKNAHGLIWEWVDNFSESIMSGDSRGGSGTESLFCGGAALKAKDPRLYATFMRFAFRNSLTAKYTSENLGFRCVRDIKDGIK